MSISYDVIGLPTGSDVSPAMKRWEASDLTEVAQDRRTGDTVVSDYVIPSVSSAARLVTARIAITDARGPNNPRDPFNGMPVVRRCSYRLSTYVEIADSVTGLSTFAPIEAVVAFNFAPNSLPPADDVLALLNATFGLTHTVSSGSQVTTRVGRNLIGITAL